MSENLGDHRGLFDGGQALHELERRHHDVGGAVLVGALGMLV
jgi:hypothetical protein